jgi:hypothetical protein
LKLGAIAILVGLLLAQGMLSPLIPAAAAAVLLGVLIYAERVAIGYAPIEVGSQTRRR